MIKQIFIVAETLEEFRYLTRKHNNLSIELKYVQNPNMLRGYRGIRVEFTERGFRRDDIREIYLNIIMANIGTQFENQSRALKMELLLYA